VSCDPDLLTRALSPFDEAVAYELLWSDFRATKRTIGTLFKTHPGPPSPLLDRELLAPNPDPRRLVLDTMRRKHGTFSVAVRGTYKALP